MATGVLEDAVNRTVLAAFAPATVLRYKGVWKLFSAFADAHRPGWSMPVGPSVVALFGAWLDKQGYKPSTISGHLYAVGWWHKLQGWADPAKAYVVRTFLTGLRKVRPDKKQAKPLRFPDLTRVVGGLDRVFDSFETKLFSAALWVGYFASLRVGEFAVSGSAQHTLRLENVSWEVEDSGESLVLYLPSYKCSPFPAKLLLPAGPVKSACAVTALRSYLAVRGPSDGVLFKKRSGAPLRAGDVTAALRRGAQAAGLDPTGLSGHSLRAGRTTDLVEMGVGDAVIRQSGRWRSNAFLQYVRFDLFRLPGGAPQ